MGTSPDGMDGLRTTQEGIQAGVGVLDIAFDVTWRLAAPWDAFWEEKTRH